jgi:hypothetical protein
MKVTVHNPEPTYLTAENVVTYELAEQLVDLVNERGKRSAWSYNPDCTELQIANPFSQVSRKNDEKIIDVLPDLFALGESFMRKMNLLFKNNACEYITGYHGFWILRYDAGGKFDLHCDWDSGPNGIRPPIVATACVLLNDQFDGGETLLLSPPDVEFIIPREKYSVAMWDGFTQHRVAPVTSGQRYVLVIHYTGNVK